MGETMSEQKSFFTTLPGILTGLAALITAVAGLLYALSATGILGSGKDKETKPVAATASVPVATPPRQPAPALPKGPKEPTTDGWAIIGFYKQGRFSDLKLMVHGDSPAVGRSYDAVDNFRVILKKPKRGKATITLGKVHRGDSVEILDMKIPPGTERVPVWAKLRAVLHRIERSSR